MPRLEMPETAGGRPKIFLACSGLGTIQRGYESFMRDLFAVLSAEGSLDVRLFKGSGPHRPRERPLRHLPRGGFGARALGGLSGRGPYVVEEATFAASLIPHVVRERPDVILFPDPAIGKSLWAWRRLFGGEYRLVLHNSGPHPAPFPRFDHIHQVTPSAMAEAVAAGHDPARQTLIPSGFHPGPPPRPLPEDERAALRRALGLPVERPVVLSVGALNRGHKRMDYVIEELASLPEPRPFLVLLGEEESDTPAVRALAAERLGGESCFVSRVSREELTGYYRAADLFVLASTVEGFGLVLAEALAHGLPCITHDHPVSRFVLEDQGRLADLRWRGALAWQIEDALAAPNTAEIRARRYRSARNRFGWSELTPRYVAMLGACAAATAPAPVAHHPVGRVTRAGAPPAHA